MLNLLIISSNPVAETLKAALQPLLKIRIDVVADFDHGLKDVFEKRPAIVCIQDQISGVTGESVARHIQMLLGSTAPLYIMMHEGNSRIKPLKGLFEQLVDLNQPPDEVVKNLLAAMKSALGDQWDKVYTPPRKERAAILASVAVSENDREVADRLVDDLLSDLESAAPPPPSALDQTVSELPAAGPPDAPARDNNFAHSTADELASLLVEQARQAPREETSPAAPAMPPEPPPFEIRDGQLTPAEPLLQQKPHTDNPFDSADSPPPAQKPPVRTAKPKQPKAPPAQPSATPEPPEPDHSPLNTQAPPPAAPQPAEFRVTPVTTSADEPIPEELLLAFEENYHARNSGFKRYLIPLAAVVCLAGGWWYLTTRKPEIMPAMLRIAKPPVTAPAPAPARPVAPSPPAAPAAAKPVASPVPSFIGSATRDEAYAAGKPGWERLLAPDAEFRIFRDNGTVRAVQVLSRERQHLNEALFQSVLSELAGSREYSIQTRETKGGFRIERGHASERADVVRYSSKGVLRAFVVSVK